MVASKLNSEGKDGSPHGPAVEDVKGMLQTFIESKITWVHREMNCIAFILDNEHCRNEL